MYRVSAKSRGLQSVADLAKARGTDTNALRNIEDLDLSRNNISSLLVEFDVGTDRSKTSSSSATETNHSSNHDTTSVLHFLTSLKVLDLHKNQLGRTSLNGLQVVGGHLCRLNVADNQLENLNGLAECIKLQYLNISGNRLKSIKGLPKLTEDVNSGFQLVASRNFITSSASLHHELNNTVAFCLVDLDISYNQLDSPPLPLLVSSPLGDSERNNNKYPNLKRVVVSCNPFLVNRSLESSCEALVLSAVTNGSHLPRSEVQERLHSCDSCMSFMTQSLSSREPCERVIIAAGRSAADEESWKNALAKRLSALSNLSVQTSNNDKDARAVAASTLDSRSSTSSNPDGVAAVEEFNQDHRHYNQRKHFNVDLADSDASDLSTSHQYVHLPGQGRTSAFDTNQVMSRHSHSQLVGAVDEPSSCTLREPTKSSSRASSNGVNSNEGARLTSSGFPAVGSTEAALERLAAVTLSKENRALKKEVDDLKRLLRDQLATIRGYKEEQEKNLTTIQELQDKLKRKHIESECTLRRARDAESTVISLKEKENLQDMTTTGQHLTASHSLKITGNRAESAEDDLSKRVFCLAEQDRKRLVETRSLSKHLSCSFDKNDKLLPGRYPHAHRSYVYEKDLDQPTDERLRYERLSSKHRIEHEVANRHGPSHAEGGGVFPTSLTVPKDHEVIMFLYDKVAELEARCREQETYCDDLSRENDELLSRHEALVERLCIQSSS